MPTRNDGFITRFVEAFFIFVVIVPSALILQYIENSRREARFAAFEDGDFCLVVLREHDDETEEQIVESVRTQCTLQSVETFEDRELLRVECDRETLDGLPVPHFLQKYEFEGEPHYGVIYAIFAGSDSVQHMKEWLRAHRYESKVPLERGWSGELDGTESFAPRQNFRSRTSQIEVAAYFWSGHFWNRRLNLWNGDKLKALHDLGDRDFVRWHTRYVNWLRKAAQ